MCGQQSAFLWFSPVPWPPLYDSARRSVAPSHHAPVASPAEPAPTRCSSCASASPSSRFSTLPALVAEGSDCEGRNARRDERSHVEDRPRHMPGYVCHRHDCVHSR